MLYIICYIQFMAFYLWLKYDNIWMLTPMPPAPEGSKIIPFIGSVVQYLADGFVGYLVVWILESQIMIKYCLEFGEKSGSGGIWGGLGGVSEAMLNDLGLVLCCAFGAARWLPRWPSRRSRTPRWAKMAPKRRQNWAKMASWARNWKLLRAF